VLLSTGVHNAATEWYWYKRGYEHATPEEESTRRDDRDAKIAKKGQGVWVGGRKDVAFRNEEL
jgi:hypothetical protein